MEEEKKGGDLDPLSRLDKDFKKAQEADLGRVIAVDESKKEEKPAEDHKLEENKEEDKEEAPEKKPEDPDEDDKPDSPSVEGEEDEDELVDEPEGEDDEEVLPKTYIPVKQYKDEKKTWKQKEAEYQKKIEDLNSIVSKGGGSQKENEALKSYADKHGLDIEGVKELATILKQDIFDNDDIKYLKSAAEDTRKAAEIAHFEKEWTDATPKIKELFPTATDEQVKEMKKQVDADSHTEWGASKEISYILWSKKDEYSKFIKEPVKRDKTAETGKVGRTSGNVKLSADDFKKGKDGKRPKSFDELAKLSDEEQKTIVSALDPDAHWDWGQYLRANQNGVEVSRKGQKVILK